MESLYLRSNQKALRTNVDFTRYLFDKIGWNNRLISIKGARGVGKTTLLLQYLKTHLDEDKSLYVSMDDLFFADHKLYNVAKEHHLRGGRHLLLDEVHKYPNWSREIKLIYDDFEDLQVVFTSSAILEIYKGESDLSRRSISYTLRELSLREFIYFSGGPLLPSFSIDELLKNHSSIAADITSQISPIAYFEKYKEYGAYPYFIEDIDTYQERLQQNIQLVLEIDIPAVLDIDYSTVVMLKKLLRAIATSAPFTPNISKLASLMEVSRQSLIKALNYLDRVRLTINLSRNSKGIGILSKPDKILLNNSNLAYLLGVEKVNIGAVKETFFANQVSTLHSITIPEFGDFLIDNSITIEIGGKNKKTKQVSHISNSYVVRDDVDIGRKDILPLWVFGMLY